MLEKFYDYIEIEQIRIVCNALNELKKRLIIEDYENFNLEYNQCIEVFEKICRIAIERNDEELANAQFIFKNYFCIFSNLMSYFGLLNRKIYKESWNRLQDCIDVAQYVSKFSENRFEIPNILELLHQYEGLYPYKIFASSEYVVTKSHCSICGKSMQSLQCTHMKGNVYWGKPAIECIDEIKTIQAVCIVAHPEDKRCVLEVANDERDEVDKFKKLDLFLELGLPRLQKFSIESVTESRITEDESGKKLYHQHEKNNVIPEDIVELYINKK